VHNTGTSAPARSLRGPALGLATQPARICLPASSTRGSAVIDDPRSHDGIVRAATRAPRESYAAHAGVTPAEPDHSRKFEARHLHEDPVLRRTEMLPWVRSYDAERYCDGMNSSDRPDFEREMAAAQEAIDAVTTEHLGRNVEFIFAQLKEQFAARGVDLADDDWLRKNCAEPIASGQPMIVVEDVDKWRPDPQ